VRTLQHYTVRVRRSQRLRYRTVRLLRRSVLPLFLIALAAYLALR
jgi:hypothetical protein